MQETEISFSSRLKELRGLKTQAVIANELGTNQQTYARWELGDRQPKLQDLASVALHFGVSADWLLGLSTAPPVKTMNCSMAEKQDLFVAGCQECPKKDAEIRRLNKIIDKLVSK